MSQYTKRTFAEVHLDRLAHNLERLKELAPGKKICAMVKADAYGHGAPAVSKKLSACGVDWFGVATADEAIQLRREGIREPVLILGYTPVEQTGELLEYGLTQCVYSLEYAAALSTEAKRCGGVLQAHIKVDTGMSRLGVLCQDTTEVPRAAAEILKICALPGLACGGIFTHFADASDASGIFTQMQYKRFRALIDALAEEGVSFPLHHCSASAAILNFPALDFDMVRPGIALYGLHPDGGRLGEKYGLQPVMSLKSVVAFLKEIEAGATVSYGRTFKAGKKLKIATVPVGYGDGYPRVLSNSADLIIRGRRVPVVGRVCMDQLMVDVTKLESVQVGDEVLVFGESGKASLPVDELAALTDTISYELLCDLNKRVPRIYLEGEREVGVQYALR